jgi:hypothetical protein
MYLVIAFNGQKSFSNALQGMTDDSPYSVVCSIGDEINSWILELRNEIFLQGSDKQYIAYVKNRISILCDARRNFESVFCLHGRYVENRALFELIENMINNGDLTIIYED